MKVAILTISTRGSRGERAVDVSGDAIKEMMQQAGAEIVDYQMIPDDKPQIIWHLKRMCEAIKADVILTTGGTGLSPTDVTPEATLEVVERRVPGIEEVMRMTGFQKTPYALLSRGVAGTREKTLIINLPGNPAGVRENLTAVLPVLPHAVAVLRGNRMDDNAHSPPV